MKNNDSFKSIEIICSETVFLLLPLLVIYLLNPSIDNLIELLKSKDLGLVAIVCWGQNLVKIITALIKSEKKIKWKSVSFYVSSVIAFGLLPSTIFFCQIHLNRYLENSIYWLQGLFFLLSLTNLFTFGLFAQDLLDSENV
ncbi:hypothetical protein EHQ96_00160 [Leptospira levettii]|uniref:hypothetical protein n=1 Tax=Leptospira levettii TaxID=2023178 RepID=UPI00108368BD|nr:hypothetical protein [Leptospira levettii]TGM73616.1 hypothetical protein EHQ96_00160 [Leptospira levettii]